MSAIPADSSPTLEVRCFTRESSQQDFELALQLRRDVFVTEQAGPAEEEPDHFDDDAMHWLFLDAQGKTVATGRVVSYQEGCQMRPVAKIGRIAVDKQFRGMRMGDRMMREILKNVRAEGYEQSILDAQTYALPFYEKLGFVAEGDEFDDGGIPHKRMRLILN